VRAVSKLFMYLKSNYASHTSSAEGWTPRDVRISQQQRLIRDNPDGDVHYLEWHEGRKKKGRPAGARPTARLPKILELEGTENENPVRPRMHKARPAALASKTNVCLSALRVDQKLYRFSRFHSVGGLGTCPPTM
jgi:hypothetical protein